LPADDDWIFVSVSQKCEQSILNTTAFLNEECVAT